MRFAVALALLAAPAFAQDAPAPLGAEEGMALFGDICIDTLPAFEGAGAALIEADAVYRAGEGSATWLGRENAVSFAVPEGPNGRPFCSFIFLSGDDAEATEAARDAYFGSGERHPDGRSLVHTTLINGSLVEFITLVDDTGGGVLARLQAYPVPPKGDADTKD